MKLIPIDFEYRRSSDRKMDMVSVAYKIDGEIKSHWLFHDEEAQEVFQQEIEDIHQHNLDGNDQYVFLAHNAVAEGRSFISSNVDPLNFNWIDTFAEQRCLSNHNDKIMFGNQLIKGVEVTTHRKKYGESPSTRTQKPQHSLAATTYKMLGVKIDTKEKDEVRDIIIHGTVEEVEAAKARILQYGESDIHYLEEIYSAQLEEYKRLLGDHFDPELLREEQYRRSETMVRTAWMETEGYPISFKAVKNFSLHTTDILTDIAKECNRQFPEVKPFSYDRAKNRYKQNQKNIKNWIMKSEFKTSWATTKTGYSLAREEWEKRFKNGHTFKDGCFGSQMYRYYYTKQHLNGFQSTKGKDRTFWDSVGSDGRVRAWLNPYGAQSSRFQPAATGFIPLKASWMRSLIQPDAGMAIASIDYGSEEFLLSALLSKDYKMIEAYMSGDVYLAFAKEAGMVPQDATKHSHPKERQIAKGIVLGISYSMTKVGLAIQLKITEGEAQRYIDKFNKIYNKFYKWKTSLVNKLVKDEYGNLRERKGKYRKDKFLKLNCGWTMWKDNDNDRSVMNMPIQGLGGSILRKAIELAQDAGLKVIFPLHDALYIEFPQETTQRAVDKFIICMRDAFVFYFKGTDMEEHAKKIRMDVELWGFEKEQEFEFSTGKVTTEYIHVDERSVEQYEQFKKYFEDDKDVEEL